VVTKLDRLARSLPDARDIADDLTRREVRLNLGGSVYDPTDPVGRLLFNVLAMVEPSTVTPEVAGSSPVAPVRSGPHRAASGRTSRGMTAEPSAARHLLPSPRWSPSQRPACRDSSILGATKPVQS
jgi:hypothetical protein